MAIEDAVFTVNQIQNKSLDLVDKFYEDRAQGVFYLDKDIVYLGKNSSETVTITGDGNGKHLQFPSQMKALQQQVSTAT